MPLVVPTGATMIPSRAFAKTGLSIPSIGYGAMSLSAAYTAVTNDEDLMKVIEACLDLGITHFDSADIYGGGHSETLLGKAIAKHGRSKFFLASKFGFVLEPGKGATGFDGSPAYVKKACDASLKRLGIDSIDLYYAHRVDPKTPVEETVKAMAELVKEGKVKYLGLSECSSETLRRAHKIHPISAVQSEFSLFHTTPLDNGLIETCKELGVAFVAFSPLARGFLNGKIRSPDDLGPTDFRLAIPRFSAEHFPKNLTLLAEIDKLAKEKGCTSGQLAIAWVLKQSDNIFVIPGTKRIEYLVENAGAGLVELTDEDDARLKKLLKDMPVSGDRYGDSIIARLVE